MKSEELQQLVLNVLEEMKGQDITNLDVRDLTDIADSMVICTGSSNRHTRSMADKLVVEVKSRGLLPLSVEGTDTGEWILIDLGDVIVHLMLASSRSFYNLEKLWQSAEQIRRTHAN